MSRQTHKERTEERIAELMEIRAMLTMAVARLGGIVEGAPTHRINFLQRIDALREIERQHAELADALESCLRACEAAVVTADLRREPRSFRDALFAAVTKARTALRKAGRLP